MEYRQLGRSGLKVPVFSLGTGTFGGVGEMFARWGNTDVAAAKRWVDLAPARLQRAQRQAHDLLA